MTDPIRLQVQLQDIETLLQAVHNKTCYRSAQPMLSYVRTAITNVRKALSSPQLDMKMRAAVPQNTPINNTGGVLDLIPEDATYDPVTRLDADT